MRLPDPPKWRPRFERDLPVDSATLHARPNRARQEGVGGCPLQYIGGHASLDIPAASRRLFSPHLDLEFDPEATPIRLRGRFGPPPEIWMAVAGTHFALAVLATMALCRAFVAWSMQETPWPLAGAGLAVLGILAVDELAAPAAGFVGFSKESSR